MSPVPSAILKTRPIPLKILTLAIESYFLMTEPINDTIDIYPQTVPVEAFAEATAGVEYALNELISDIALAATYTGDDAIVHAIRLTASAHTLQHHLFIHLDKLVGQKKMKAYEQNTN
jgi:hypothetical protein